jgi:hypothetical protein
VPYVREYRLKDGTRRFAARYLCADGIGPPLIQSWVNDATANGLSASFRRLTREPDGTSRG